LSDESRPITYAALVTAVPIVTAIAGGAVWLENHLESREEFALANAWQDVRIQEIRTSGLADQVDALDAKAAVAPLTEGEFAQRSLWRQKRDESQREEQVLRKRALALTVKAGGNGK